jgi:molybdopterin converting factor subunit 1
MHVKVRLFASLREETGQAAIDLELPAGATLEDAWGALTSVHPPLASSRRSLAAAVNKRYAPWPTPLGEGDEVAFIPPVSGG